MNKLDIKENNHNNTHSHISKNIMGGICEEYVYVSLHSLQCKETATLAQTFNPDGG